MKQCVLVALIIALVARSSAGLPVAADHAAQCITNTSLPSYLPRSLVPIDYSLFLDLPAPDPNGTQAYNGTVRILAAVRVETSCAMLRAKEMDVYAKKKEMDVYAADGVSTSPL